MENQEMRSIKDSNRGMITLVLVMIIVALGAYTYRTVKEAGQISPEIATITVSGEGEVLAKPDIATFSFSVLAEGDDAATAQEESAKAVNEIIGYLKAESIDEKDIKTQYYNLNPRYDYVRSVCTQEGFCPPGERVLRGYEVNQTIQVKVRAVDEAGMLISGVGARGATNVSSLQFTIDDEDVFVAEARGKAIRDAKEKAQKLADDLDVRIVKILGFYENGGGYPTPMYMESRAVGGDFAEDATVAPGIPIGENTFRSNVNITYEIR